MFVTTPCPVQNIPANTPIDSRSPSGHTEHIESAFRIAMRKSFRLSLTLIVAMSFAGIAQADPKADHWAWKQPVRP